MEVRAQRPRLVSLRVTSFKGENTALASPRQPMQLVLSQDIKLGLGVATDSTKRLLAIVNVALHAIAVTESDEPAGPEFAGTYEGKFEYPEGEQESDIEARFETELHQYVLVAQVVPLAMSHFRRELQAMGVDASKLPLGLA